MDESTIQLLTFDLDAGDLSPALSVLSADERSRAARFRLPQHADRYMRGRAALRHTLGAALAIEPAAVPLQTLASGKPALRGDFALDFSLAHCEARGVIVLGWKRALGIDVETLRPLRDREALVARHFSPAERATIATASAAQRTLLFFQCWTRKEAWLKMTGLGLRGGLAEHDTGVGNDSPIGVDASIHTLELTPGTIVSIASNRPWAALQRIS